MCVQKCPIFCVSYMALYRNCQIFTLIVVFCSPHHIDLFVSIFHMYSAIVALICSRLLAIAGLFPLGFVARFHCLVFGFWSGIG